MSAERMRNIYYQQAAMNGGIALGGLLPKGAKATRKKATAKGKRGAKYAFPASYFKEDHPYGKKHAVVRAKKVKMAPAAKKVKVHVASAAQKKAAKKNPWLIHVRAYRKKHPNLSYKEVLERASKTYYSKA